MTLPGLPAPRRQPTRRRWLMRSQYYPRRLRMYILSVVPKNNLDVPLLTENSKILFS